MVKHHVSTYCQHDMKRLIYTSKRVLLSWLLGLYIFYNHYSFYTSQEKPSNLPFPPEFPWNWHFFSRNPHKINSFSKRSQKKIYNAVFCCNIIYCNKLVWMPLFWYSVDGYFQYNEEVFCLHLCAWFDSFLKIYQQVISTLTSLQCPGEGKNNFETGKRMTRKFLKMYWKCNWLVFKTVSELMVRVNTDKRCG